MRVCCHSHGREVRRLSTVRHFHVQLVHFSYHHRTVSPEKENMLSMQQIRFRLVSNIININANFNIHLYVTLDICYATELDAQD